jgi:hypothetical protein
VDEVDLGGPAWRGDSRGSVHWRGTRGFTAVELVHCVHSPPSYSSLQTCKNWQTSRIQGEIFSSYDKIPRPCPLSGSCCRYGPFERLYYH